VAVRRALKSTALDQATQLHLSVAMFERLKPVDPGTPRLNEPGGVLSRGACGAGFNTTRRLCPNWVKDLVFNGGTGSRMRVTMVTGETCSGGYTIR
jgi:hypothetical protein